MAERGQCLSLSLGREVAWLGGQTALLGQVTSGYLKLAPAAPVACVTGMGKCRAARWAACLWQLAAWPWRLISGCRQLSAGPRLGDGTVPSPCQGAPGQLTGTQVPTATASATHISGDSPTCGDRATAHSIHLTLQLVLHSTRTNSRCPFP